MVKLYGLIKWLSFFTIAIFIFTNPCVHAQDYGDAAVSGSISDARTLMPILASDSASAEVCGMIFNGLVKYDKDLNLVGDLAESWEIKEDGLVIIFHLRKGVRWQDGRPSLPATLNLPIGCSLTLKLERLTAEISNG